MTFRIRFPCLMTLALFAIASVVHAQIAINEIRID